MADSLYSDYGSSGGDMGGYGGVPYDTNAFYQPTYTRPPYEAFYTSPEDQAKKAFYGTPDALQGSYSYKVFDPFARTQDIRDIEGTFNPVTLQPYVDQDKRQGPFYQLSDPFQSSAATGFDTLTRLPTLEMPPNELQLQQQIRDQLADPRTTRAPEAGKSLEQLNAEWADKQAGPNTTIDEYRKFLADQFIDPDTIGNATINRKTGKMEVPTTRQEYAAKNAASKAAHKENLLARIEMENRKNARMRWRDQDIGDLTKIMAMQDEGAQNAGPGRAQAEIAQKYFLNKMMSDAGYGQQRRYGMQPVQSLAIQPSAGPTYGFSKPRREREGSQSNGYQ